jgi:hypothetical protein
MDATTPDTDANNMLIELSSAAVRVRKGHELRLIISISAATERGLPRRNEKPIQILAEAHAKA